jgi:hypothetical protein
MIQSREFSWTGQMKAAGDKTGLGSVGISMTIFHNRSS